MKTSTRRPLKFASFCINLHSGVIPLCAQPLILHALDYVWSLVMYLWPWLPANHLAASSLGNDAPAEESCRGLTVCWGRSHREPSIIESDWNPAPAGGWLAGRDRSLSEGFFVAEKNLTTQSTLVDLVSGSLFLFRSHNNNDWNIQSRHLTEGWSGRGCLFSQLCLWTKPLAFVWMKPKCKIRAGSDECVLEKGPSKTCFGASVMQQMSGLICQYAHAVFDFRESYLHLEAYRLTSVLYSRARIPSAPLMSEAPCKCLWCVLTGLMWCYRLMCVSGRAVELTLQHPPQLIEDRMLACWVTLVQDSNACVCLQSGLACLQVMIVSALGHNSFSGLFIWIDLQRCFLLP